MAVAPRPFCLVMGCRSRSVAGSRKCGTHRSLPAAKPVEPVYHSAEWHRARARTLRDHPWCEWCNATTQLSVDHIVPLSAGGGHEPANLRVLCLSCHGKRSAEQSHGRRGLVRPDGTRDGDDDARRLCKTGNDTARHVQNHQREGQTREWGSPPGGWADIPAPTSACDSGISGGSREPW